MYYILVFSCCIFYVHLQVHLFLYFCATVVTPQRGKAKPCSGSPHESSIHLHPLAIWHEDTADTVQLVWSNALKSELLAQNLLWNSQVLCFNHKHISRWPAKKLGRKPDNISSDNIEKQSVFTSVKCLCTCVATTPPHRWTFKLQICTKLTWLN